MYLGWNGGQSGRVWQKKTNSFFLSCFFITHAFSHPVPIPLSLGILSTPHAAEGHVSHVGAYPSPEVVRMGEEWRDRGSCWHGGLPGGAPGTGWALRSCHCSGEDESLPLNPLPFSNFSVAAVERPGAPLPLSWPGVCTLLYLAFS